MKGLYLCTNTFLEFEYEQRKIICYNGYEKKEWLRCQTSTQMQAGTDL